MTWLCTKNEFINRKRPENSIQKLRWSYKFMTLLGLFSGFFVGFIHWRLIWDRQTINGSSSGNSSQSVITELKVFINFYLILPLRKPRLHSIRKSIQSLGKFHRCIWKRWMKKCFCTAMKTAFMKPWKPFPTKNSNENRWKKWERKHFVV